MPEPAKRYNKKPKRVKNTKTYDRTPRSKKPSFPRRVRNYFLPEKGDDFVEILRKIIFDIAFIAIIVTVIYLMITFVYPAIKTRMDQDDISNLVNSNATSTSIVPGEPAEIMGKYADVYASNPDTIGYLNIANTSIAYPVVQRTEDTKNEYYLKRNFNEEEDKHGSLFTSYHVKAPTPKDPTFADNTTIYGHHMRDGTMFAPLMKYKNLDFYKQNPTFTYDSLYEEHEWKIFGVVLTSEYGGTEPGSLDYMTPNMFENDEQFNKYVSMIKERSMINTTVDIKPDDKILALSTCDYTFSQDHGRLVLFARMVRPGEDTSVDVSGALNNADAIYPQLYYTSKGLAVPANLPMGDVSQWQGVTGSQVSNIGVNDSTPSASSLPPESSSDEPSLSQQPSSSSKQASSSSTSSQEITSESISSVSSEQSSSTDSGLWT